MYDNDINHNLYTLITFARDIYIVALKLAVENKNTRIIERGIVVSRLLQCDSRTGIY